MLACVLDHVRPTCDPSNTAPPEVLFLLDVQPALTESLKTSIPLLSGSHPYLQTNLGFVTKNLPILLSLLQLACVGELMPRQSSFTQN